MDQNREAQVHRFRGGCTSSGTAGGWFPTPLRWVGLSGLSWWRAGGEPRCWRPSARMAGGRHRRRAGRDTWEGEGEHKRRRHWSGSRLKVGFLVRINPRFTYAKLNRSTKCTVMWLETLLFVYLVIDGQQILLQSWSVICLIYFMLVLIWTAHSQSLQTPGKPADWAYHDLFSLAKVNGFLWLGLHQKQTAPEFTSL